ncbi:hypothetical protein SNE40_008765 [Patella caerulea]|uniref:F-box domain-containing protein n=1 Tax=Patella caerulea TaxID=87958 RepID=A0AAN8JV85_PATCE
MEVSDIGNTLAETLPGDILLEIFTYLDISSLISASQVCNTWHHIYNTETLWKNKAQAVNVEEKKYILNSRKQGLSWKDSFLSNYGDNLVRKKWRKGQLSTISKFEDIPARHMCKMTSAEWGDIFKREEMR